MAAADDPSISVRESEILVELGNHLTNAEIAQKLHISVRTVESHVSALLRKLGAANRRDLAARASSAMGQSQDSFEESAIGRHNIPSQASSFVGREMDLLKMTKLVEEVRLLTLLGPGGIGKTRLALQLATEQLGTRVDGVWFVDLASLNDATLLPAKAAGVLRVKEEPDRPITETLVDALQEKDLLLLLDNCEHVIDQAASLAQSIVEKCPGVTVIATSREALGIQGERVFRVPTLSVPAAGEDDPEVLRESEAVRLFCQRAEDQDSGFVLDRENAVSVTNLCRRLDGLPLAIELATARLRSLSPADIEANLDQRFRLLSGGARTAMPRHRTLQALIDWSYDLLDSEEASVLDRLSVFASGFDLSAAQAVAGGGESDPLAILDHLTSLVDKSLIHTEAGKTVRYRLLETIRDYASAKLRGLGSVAVQNIERAHRDHFLSVAEEAAPHVTGSDQVEWLDRLELELDNFRLALSYSLTDVDPGPGIRLSTSLWKFWLFRDYVIEGAAAISAQLDRPEAMQEPALRGNGVVVVANLLASFSPDLAGSLSRAQDGLTTGRALGDSHLVAQALHVLAVVNARKGDFSAAFNYADEGLATLGEEQDLDLSARLHMARANCLCGLGGDPGSDFNEAIGRFRAVGNHIAANMVLNNIGYNSIRVGDVDSARGYLDEALQTARDLGHRIGICYASYNRGLVAFLDDDYIVAKVLFVESLEIAYQSGELSEVADALFGLALTNSRLGNLEVAAKLHGAADAIDSEVGSSSLEFQARLRSEDHARLADLLGPSEFEVAYEEGQRLPIESCMSIATR